GERYKRPGYYALQMWTSHFGDVLVRNRVASDSFDVPATYGNVGPLYDIPYLGKAMPSRSVIIRASGPERIAPSRR
ncbi:unnamed protein product, partial [marine sediment metagenome]